MLRPHGEGETEQNIASAVRDFLVSAGLFRSRDLSEQIAIGDGRADLIGGSHIFEFKTRVGLGPNVSHQHLGQLDAYLEAARTEAP